MKRLMIIFICLISLNIFAQRVTTNNKLIIKHGDIVLYLTKDTLVKFILLIFTSLVSVWIIDKVVAYKINLLSEDMDKELFDLIKTLTLMIFSFYFGTKTKSD